MSAQQPWVLLRGLTRDSRHWGAFADAFRAALGTEPLLLDLAGNGARHHERSPASVAAMAQDCEAQLQQRGITGPVRVLAMSLGAMVATAWAQQQPQRVAGAVLINTSMRPFGAMHQRLRPPVWPSLFKLAWRNDDPRAAEALILRHTSRIVAGNAVQAATLLDRWSTWRQQSPVTRGNALRQLAAAARFRAPPLAPAPLLLLASTRDALVDVRCSRRLAAAWRLPLIEHASAGHDLPLDDPGWVAAQLVAWRAER